MFWKTISEYMDGFDLNISIKKNKDDLTIIIVPKFHPEKKDQTAGSPIMITGTPKEFDSPGFAATLEKPLKVTREISKTLKMYEDSLTKIAEDAKEKVKNQSKKNTKKEVDTKQNSLI